MNKNKPIKLKPFPIKWLFLTLGILIASTGALYGIDKYKSPTLYGKWISRETGECIKFNKDGTVLLENISYTPSFILLESEKMTYTVDNKTFTMHYVLKGRDLEWYLENGEKESFTRR